MDYVVTAGLKPPVDMPELDGLQQEGITALLDRLLALVEGVAGPEDSEIDVLDYRITTLANRVTVVLALDAPSLAAAEDAAATVLHEVLGEHELLTGWSVAESEVRITEDEFNQSLAAAESTPASDDVETGLEAAIDEVLESPEEQETTLDTEHWRSKLAEMAEQLRAFGPEAFGGVGEPGENAELAAGALIHAVRVVTDEIFYDEMALAINNATVADAVGLLVLEDLPPLYQQRYDSLFARAFLLASVTVAQRLTSPEWTPPRCVAETLAMHLFINEARVLLEASQLMTWEASQPLFDVLEGHAYSDRSHGELYEWEAPTDVTEAASVETGLHSRSLAFEQWFHLPEGRGDGVHPYLRSL